MTRTSRLLLALAWTIGILVATNIPPSSVPDVDGDHLDKLVHFVMFFGFGWLWMWALRPPLYRRFLYVALAGVAIAVLTEALQGWIGIGRQANIWDVVANLAGLFCAIGLYLMWHFRQREPAVKS